MVFLAALVKLAENATGAGGVPATCQEYVRLPSPPSSVPRTARPTVVPVTGAALAAAGISTAGAALAMVTEAVPLLPARVAVTKKGPPVAAPAVKRPAELTVPPPLAAQTKVGGVARGTPNWSF